MTKRARTDYIVIHCAATKPDMDIGAKEIRQWHTAAPPKGNGWSDIGYHFVIRRSGVIEPGRPQDALGAHVKGYNFKSIGVCLVGGTDDDGHATDMYFTKEQWNTLRCLVLKLKLDYPTAKVVGHRDLDHGKECPSFDVASWCRKEGIK